MSETKKPKWLTPEIEQRQNEQVAHVLGELRNGRAWDGIQWVPVGIFAEIADLRAQLEKVTKERDDLIDVSQKHDCDYYEVEKERDALRALVEKLKQQDAPPEFLDLDPETLA